MEKRSATDDICGLSHRFGQLYLLRIAYCVLRMGYSVFRISYCVMHNASCSIFNATVKNDISIALAERMIIATYAAAACPPIITSIKCLFLALQGPSPPKTQK